MHLIVDFDGTISQSDTIAELVRSAIQRQRQQQQQQQEEEETQAHTRDLQSAWDHALKTYLADYNAYKTSHTPPQPQRTTPAQEAIFLAGLRPLEEASLTRVSRSELFRGLSRHALREMGIEAVSSGRIRLRSGWEGMLAWARGQGIPVTVLSVHWSRSFIGGVLSCDYGGGRCDAGGAGIGVEAEVEVIANEIDEDGVIIGPGGDGISRLMTAGDKMDELRRRSATASGGDCCSSGSSEDDKVVYLGDSVTDLTCLLEAWRGIVLVPGENESSSPLLDTLRRIGIHFIHVGDMASRSGAAGSACEKKKVVFWARDMQEVLRSGILGT
ncbi:hypothetical protein E4U21_002242 [Claviceps maximensis]|nr:hypothetical protein E4U21_002242 [Claviceps maximensis]